MFVDVCDPRSLNHDRFRRLRTHDLGQSDEAMFHCSRHRSVVDGFAQKRRPGRGGRRANERCGFGEGVSARPASREMQLLNSHAAKQFQRWASHGR